MTRLKSDTPLSDSDEEALRQLYLPIWTVAEQMTGDGRASIPLAISFTTQREFNVLTLMHEAVAATSPSFTLAGQATTPAQVDNYYANLGKGGVPHSHVGMVFNGTLTSPAYESDLEHQIAFQNGAPVAVGTGNVPFVATVPASAAGPVPVLIFQHQFGGEKYDALEIADAASAAGFGVIAIDAVAHGERALPNLPSGTEFIDLSNLRLDRDHVYQSVNDMFSEARLVAVGDTAFSGGAALFATDQTTFVGQSLGAILGGTFMAMESSTSVGVLNVGGGKVVELLLSSPSLSTPYLANLNAQGIFEGTPQFDQYVLQAQTVLDDVDPFNYGPHVIPGDLAGGTPHAVLMQEMINDQTVPNPNTEALARAIGVTQVDAVQRISLLAQASTPFEGSAIYQFTGGSHGFLLDTSQGPTVAAQTQVMQYLTSGLAGAPTVNAAASKRSVEDWGVHHVINVPALYGKP